MFKVIQDNRVIDTLKDVVYLRFIPSVNKFVATDSTSAHAFYASDAKTIYQLQDRQCPATDRDIEIAKLVKITEMEFEELTRRIQESKTLFANAAELQNKIDCKISELSSACKEAIISGITVRLSDGKLHEFDLTIEDQLNLSTLEQHINKGARRVLYHERGCIVRYFDSSDIQRVINAATYHKEYHTTYMNILKNHVKTATNLDEINCVYYGMKLKDLNLSPELYKIAKENNIG